MGRSCSHQRPTVAAPQWVAQFEAWKTQVYVTWAAHLAPLLKSKVQALIRPDLDALLKALGVTVDVDLPLPAPLRTASSTAEPLRNLQDKFDVPTVWEAIFELFKGSLSTVAMIAGMVVIPVIGSLMHTASTEIRAIVMGATVAPITLFAVLSGRKQRRKLLAQNLDKARERLRKSIATEVKSELDRFKFDAERYTAQYCVDAQAAVANVFDKYVAHVFERREKQVVTELAQAQLQTDRLNDQINVLRQLRSQMTGQLIVDLKRRLQDLVAQGGAAAKA